MTRKFTESTLNRINSTQTARGAAAASAHLPLVFIQPNGARLCSLSFQVDSRQSKEPEAPACEHHSLVPHQKQRGERQKLERPRQNRG